METVLIIISLLIVYGALPYFSVKYLKRQRIKDMTKIVNQMVDDGEITRDEGDAVIWVINYSSRKK